MPYYRAHYYLQAQHATNTNMVALPLLSMAAAMAAAAAITTIPAAMTYTNTGKACQNAANALNAYGENVITPQLNNKDIGAHCVETENGPLLQFVSTEVSASFTLASNTAMPLSVADLSTCMDAATQIATYGRGAACVSPGNGTHYLTLSP
jgi:hypothetical protein